MDGHWGCMDGNEAAARVAYAASEVIAIYPITPASPMAEYCDDWSAAEAPNPWRVVPDAVEMRSDAGAAGALRVPSTRGPLATTFCATGRGTSPPSRPTFGCGWIVASTPRSTTCGAAPARPVPTARQRPHGSTT